MKRPLAILAALALLFVAQSPACSMSIIMLGLDMLELEQPPELVPMLRHAPFAGGFYCNGTDVYYYQGDAEQLTGFLRLYSEATSSTCGPVYRCEGRGRVWLPGDTGEADDASTVSQWGRPTRASYSTRWNATKFLWRVNVTRSDWLMSKPKFTPGSYLSGLLITVSVWKGDTASWDDIVLPAKVPALTWATDPDACGP